MEASVLSRAASTFVAASHAGLWTGAAAMRDGDAPPIGAVGRIFIDCVAEQRLSKSRNISSSNRPIPIGMECDWVRVSYLLDVTDVPVQTPCFDHAPASRLFAAYDESLMFVGLGPPFAMPNCTP